MAFSRSLMRYTSAKVHQPIFRRPFTSTPSRWTAPPPVDSGGGNETRNKIPFAALKRPLAKVFLASFLTYQIIYLIWLKLETDEARAEMQNELSGLEKQARELLASKDSKRS